MASANGGELGSCLKVGLNDVAAAGAMAVDGANMPTCGTGSNERGTL